MSSYNIIVLISMSLLYINSCNSLTFPSEVKICSRSDSNVEICISEAIEKVMTLFQGGNSEFRFPTLVPLKIPKLTINAGSGPVNVAQNYENIEIHGLLPTNVKSVQLTATDDGINIKFETLNPKVSLLGHYNIDGKVLLLPARGNGQCNITIDNLHIYHEIDGEFVERNNQKYLDIKKYEVRTTPEHAYYNFENLFDGDETLGSQLNQLLNENWKEIYHDVSVGYDKALGLIFKDISNLIFANIPIDDLLKP